MEQHPVPQNISSYQFHLVGDMTLKQFLELGAGVLIGVLIYATGLPAIIKWPLILFFAAGGAALAFVPLEERPLEKWIYAFFRSVYSPTLFHWEKRENVKYFQDETAIPATPFAGETKTISPFAKIPFLNKLEEGESNYLTKLAGIFNPTVPVADNANALQTTQTQNVQPVGGTTIIADVPQQEIISQPQIVPGGGMPTMTTINPMASTDGQVLTMHSATETQNAGSVPGVSLPTKRDIVIPQTTYISVDKQTQGDNEIHPRPQVVVQETGQAQPSVPFETVMVKTAPVANPQNNIPAQAAVFSPDAAHPSVPTIIDTVSGQVMDSNKKIVEGAILEIIDESGRPVRALRSNKAGHFLIVTPLTAGKYKILIEKEGLSFDPVSFEAKGAIIEPIAIQAKG